MHTSSFYMLSKASYRPLGGIHGQASWKDYEHPMDT